MYFRLLDHRQAVNRHPNIVNWKQASAQRYERHEEPQMNLLRTVLAAAALAIIPHPLLGQNSKNRLPLVPEGKTWKLAWHDEFDGKDLDESKWICSPDGERKGGWWSHKAVNLDGKGDLVIKTFKDGDKYVDGCITTQGKFEHCFGYYVARVKFQKQPGHWSAFWMMCNGVGSVGSEGRDGTEIDIMEKPWLDDRVQQTLH
jgi:beta-glucanase (GH16 family)